MSVCLGCRGGGRVNEGFGGWLSGMSACNPSKQGTRMACQKAKMETEGGIIYPYELSCVVCRGNVRYGQAQCTRG